MEPGKSSKTPESMTQSGFLKKVPSIKAESETQTSVAVRVPSVKLKSPVSSAPVESNMEKLVTQEQLKNASVAKKRRMITKKAQGVRTREKTPEPNKNLPYPVPHEDTTTTDEEDVISPKTPEMEADDIYLEMKKKIREKHNEPDLDDIDIDAIREAQVEEARERRRRSISPFALPSKEEIEKLQRKGSFIDPGNKLLTTVPSYPLTPKDEIDPEIIRRNSMISEDDIKLLNMPPSPKSPEKYSDISLAYSTSKGPQAVPEKPKSNNLTQNTKKETNQSRIVNQPKPLQTHVDAKSKQPNQKPITNVSVTKQFDNETLASNSPNNSEPPVRPKRSKSGTRSQGRTSESEMSEDQSKPNTQPLLPQPKAPKPRERRRTIAAIKRSVRERSPVVRSRSAARIEKPLDTTGIEMTPTTSEIIDLLQKARRRSLSIPEDDLKTSIVSRNITDNNRQLMTPKKKPSSPKTTRRATTPKTIKILTNEETLQSFLQAQRKSVEMERSRRSSGYIDASQSELTSSCYSSSYSEDESDFDLRKKSDELSRKLSLLKSESESKKTVAQNKEVQDLPVINEPEITGKESRFRRGILQIKRIIINWKNFKIEKQDEWKKVRLLGNRCSSDLIILIIMCGFGGLIFRYSEGAFENFYKCGVKRVKRDFIDTLWQGSHNLREDDWKSMARKKLWDFETQLHTAHEAGVKSYSGQKSWSFMNSAVYCLTVVTTIGYGHIAPSTTTGRALTILYAIIGIPLFLILLADFGKLFTRCIKFFWAFVRRVYYTGSCRKVRRTVPMQEVMKGLNMVYEAASTLRRPSQFNIDAEVAEPNRAPELLPKPGQTPNQLAAPSINKSADGATADISDDPQTPAPSVFEIDDEFNLPISVAITCLIIYIFMGACIYMVWEEWTFFESFYFVFISMSTIGFGDFVPNHPIYMMCSIVYLVFGMSLTSMCINVVQVKLSDTFRHASAKIGATIGLKVSEEDGSLAPITPPPIEIPPVHSPAKSADNSSPVNV